MNKSPFLNTIQNMDCLDGMKMIPDKSIDLIVTDPPYNIKKAEWDKIKNYEKWCKKWLLESNRILKDNGSIWIFVSSWFLPKVCNVFDEIFHRRNIIIWAYPNGRVTQNGFAERYEPIIYGVKNKNKFTFNPDKIRIPRKRKDNRYQNKYSSSGKVPESVWFLNRLVYTPYKHRFGFHPTKKPTSVIERMINVSSNDGDLVLDMFVGSGTTGYVALNLNRNFIGFEINPEYCKMAEERLKKVPKRIDKFV